MFFFGTGRLLLLGNCCLWGHPGPSGVGSPPGCHGCHLHPPSPARAPRGCLPMSRRDAGGLRVRGSSSAWEKNLRTGQERNMGNHGNVISNCQQLHLMYVWSTFCGNPCAKLLQEMFVASRPQLSLGSITTGLIEQYLVPHPT